MSPQPLEDSGTSRPSGRIASKQLLAQPDQVFGKARDQGVGSRRDSGLFEQHDLVETAVEREPAGERLVEDHADAVPVAGGRDRQPQSLLGRHVSQSTNDLPGHRMMLTCGFQIGHQTEVEQDHPAVPGDQHVGRFDVAVQLPRGVQSLNTLGELNQPVPQPGFVSNGPRGRPGGAACCGKAHRPPAAVHGRRRSGSRSRPPAPS